MKKNYTTVVVVNKDNPTPTLPLAGEGVKGSRDSGPSLCQGGGWEGVKLKDWKRVFNDTRKTSLRRELRKNSTEPECRLWAKIRDEKLGIKFRRQHGIGRYIADFYCPKHSLVIELDGDSHYTPEAQEYDRERDKFMHSLGLQVLRFSNLDILLNVDGVLRVIVESIDVLEKQPPL
jgi:very-short-patch-repair endonuclease